MPKRFLLPLAAAVITVIVIVVLSAHRDKADAGTPHSPSSRITVVQTSSPAIQRQRTFSHASASHTTPARFAARSTSITLILTGNVHLVDGSVPSSATVELARSTGRDITPWKCEITTATVPDSGGAYRLEFPAEKNMHLFFRGAGLATRVLTVTPSGDLTAQADSDPPTITRHNDVVMVRAALFRGRVTGAAGHPLPAAFIKASFLGANHQHDIRVTTSSADGTFQIDDLPPGAVAVGVSHPDHQPWHGTTDLPQEHLTVALRGGGATMTGEVISWETGAPLAGAHVLLRSHTQRTHISSLPEMVTLSDGRFHLAHVPPGTYWLNAERQGMSEFHRGENPLGKIELAGDETTHGLQIRMFSGFTVRGTIRDATTSKPLAGVSYSSNHATRDDAADQSLTDSSGAFEISNIRETGKVWIPLHHSGYHILDEDGEPVERAAVDLQKETSPTFIRDLTMVPSRSLAGRVVDESGIGVPGAKVSLLHRKRFDEPMELPVESDGQFSLPLLSEKSVSLKAQAAGYGPGYLWQHKLADSPSEELRIVLSRPGKIEGMVTDSAGKPLSGIDVRASYIYQGHAVTGNLRADRRLSSDFLGKNTSAADGRFRFAGLPPGKLFVRAHDPGGEIRCLELITLQPGEERGDLLLVLNDLKSISGTVRSAVDEKPIGGAAIQVNARTGHSRGSGTSDADGLFRIENLDAATSFGMSVTHDGYDSNEADGLMPGGELVEIKLTPRKLSPLIVRMVDSHTDQPVPDSTLKARDEDGDLSIERVERIAPGEYRIADLRTKSSVRLEASAAGYVPLKRSVTISDREPVTEITLYLRRGVAVIGRVVSRGDRKPRKGMGVIAGNKRYGIEDDKLLPTDADGRFRIPDVPPGNGVFAVFSEPSMESGEPLLFRTIDVPAGEDLDLGTLEVGEGVTLKGRLLRADNGRPVVGEVIELNFYRKDRKITTDDNGAFRFENLPPIPGQSVSLALPRRDITYHVASSPEEVDGREFILRLGGATLKGQTLLAGQPESCIVSATLGSSARGEERSTRSDASGEFELKDLVPGRWEITASSRRDDIGNGTAHVDVPEHGATEVTIHLSGGKVTGRVVDTDGKPVHGVTVTLKDIDSADPFSGSTAGSTKTGSDGAFSFNSLKPGAYTLSAREAGKGVAETRIELPIGGHVEGVELRLTRGEGTIISLALDAESGEPLESAWCRVYRPDGTPLGSLQHERGPDGILRLEELPAGDLIVQVSANEYTLVTHNITLEPGETKSLTDLLEPAGELTWSIQKENGSAVPDLPVRLVPAGDKPGATRQGKTDGQGQWKVSGLAFGQYDATVTLPDGGQKTETINVELWLPTSVLTVVE